MSLSGSGSTGTSAGAIEAGKAFIAIDTNDAAMVAGLKRVGNTLSEWTNKVGESFNAATAVFQNTFSSFFDSVNNRINTIADFANVADRLDASVKDVSTMGYVMEMTGKDLYNLEQVMKHVKTTAKEAFAGTSQASNKAFTEMGVHSGDFLKMGLIDRLRLMKKTYKSMEGGPLASNKQADFLISLADRLHMQVLPLMKMTNEQFEGLLQEAERVGRVVDDNLGESARNAKRNIIAMTNAFNSIYQGIIDPIIALIGDGKELSLTIQYISQSFKNFLSTFSPVTKFLFIVGAGFVAIATAAGLMATLIGIAFTTLVGIVSSLSTVLIGIIGGFIALLASTLGVATVLTVGALLAITAASSTFSNKLITVFNDIKGSIGTIGEAFGALWTTATLAFTGIMAAIRNKDFAGANQIVTVAMQLAWLEFKNACLVVFEEIFGGFRAMINKMLKAMSYFGTEFRGSVRIWTLELLKFLGSSPAKTNIFGADNHKAREAFAKKHKERAEWFDAKLEEEKEDMRERLEKLLKFDPAEAGDVAKNRAERMGPINELRRKLKELVDLQTKEVMGPPKPVGGSMKDAPMASALAEAVKGTFRSSDFKGALGIGPASNYAKEQAKTQKDILKEVKDIREKMKFAEFR